MLRNSATVKHTILPRPCLKDLNPGKRGISAKHLLNSLIPSFNVNAASSGKSPMNSERNGKAQITQVSVLIFKSLFPRLLCIVTLVLVKKPSNTLALHLFLCQLGILPMINKQDAHNANTSNADANNKATSSSTTTTHQKATTDSTASSSLATDQQKQQNSHPHNHTTEQKKQQTDYNNDPEQIQQEQQKGFKGQAKKDMQKVEGYVAEREGEGIDEEKQNELEKITVSKEDIEFIINEMEVTRSVADKYLRENKGDVVEALRAL
ncbi:8204_t:CDS:2, partial [Entrophospora sp. SA101]